MAPKPEEFNDTADADGKGNGVKSDELASLSITTMFQALHLHCLPSALISEMRKLRHFPTAC